MDCDTLTILWTASHRLLHRLLHRLRHGLHRIAYFEDYIAWQYYSRAMSCGLLQGLHHALLHGLLQRLLHELCCADYFEDYIARTISRGLCLAGYVTRICSLDYSRDCITYCYMVYFIHCLIDYILYTASKNKFCGLLQELRLMDCFIDCFESQAAWTASWTASWTTSSTISRTT
jgi:hypothetical protein